MIRGDGDRIANRVESLNLLSIYLRDLLPGACLIKVGF